MIRPLLLAALLVTSTCTAHAQDASAETPADVPQQNPQPVPLQPFVATYQVFHSRAHVECARELFIDKETVIIGSKNIAPAPGHIKTSPPGEGFSRDGWVTSYSNILPGEIVHDLPV